MSFEVDDSDEVYPTSPGRVRMMRILAFSLAAILFLFMAFALVL